MWQSQRVDDFMTDLWRQVDPAEEVWGGPQRFAVMLIALTMCFSVHDSYLCSENDSQSSDDDSETESAGSDEMDLDAISETEVDDLFESM
ncbi:hypothetical protein HDU90_006850 [Geranomyces variabilis]|nr:hypothetical protein HDU90_006850 [Geranomyces variabilis]